MSVSVLAPVLLGGAVGAGLLLVVVGVRGTVNDPSRPPSPAARLITALRRPAMARRVAAGVVVGLLVLMVTGWPVAALGLGALMALWPRLFGGSAAEARQIAELEALVVWVESLKDTIAGHASLEHAIRHPRPPHLTWCDRRCSGWSDGSARGSRWMRRYARWRPILMTRVPIW